jgi:hypothetical protein
MRIPDFFIVGAPKCGTTAMWHYLRQHPDIFMPASKELPFLGSDVAIRPRLTRRQYLAHFAGVAAERRVGSAWVMHLYSRLAAEEIKGFAPSADVVIMLRNPVEMLHSLHAQLLFTGQETIEDFGDALDAEADRRQGRGRLSRVARRTGWSDLLIYREHARYADQVGRYFDVFGRDRVHVVVYDDFAADTERSYGEMVRFLGVDDGFAPQFQVVNASKVSRNRALQNVLRHPPIPLRSAANAVLPPYVRRRLSGVLRRVRAANTRYVPRRPLDPELRARLSGEFAPEVERLGQRLSRDLTHWVG